MSEQNNKATGVAGAAPRRLRYGFSTAVILLAVTASCVIAGALGTRWSARFDVTATREHTISPRTRALLNQLDQATEVVVAVDFARIDPRAALHMRDVLAGFDQASDLVEVTEIDLGSPGGRDAFRTLVDRLAGVIGARVGRHESTLREAIASVRDAENALEGFSATLLKERERLSASSSGAEGLSRIAAAARILARSAGEAIDEAESQLEERVGGSGLAGVDSARRSAGATMDALLVDLDALVDAVIAIGPALDANAGVDPNAAANTLRAVRDGVARAADKTQRLAPIQTLSAIRTIEAGSGAVVIAGERARAIPVEALFPPTALIDRATTGVADLRFVGESLLAASIGSLSGVRTAPIVVLVHGAEGLQLDDQGRPQTQDAQRAFGSLLESLHLRGVRVAEWAPATGRPRPTFAGEDGGGERPVVWATFPVQVRSAGSAQRMSQHAAAVEGLIASGESVLLSFDASTLPSVGETDPMADPLAALGIRVRTGASMLRRMNTPDGTIVDGQFVLRSANREHAIGRAIDGLAIRLAWPCPIETEAVSGVVTWPLLTQSGSAHVWGEMEWMAYRSLSPTQRAMVADTPTPDPGVDLVDGPWTLALAAERAASGSDARMQRLVVVGANGWFTDVVARDSTTVDGRTVLKNPGNAELFDAAVSWLAHQDDLIGSGPGAFETPRIPSMSPGRLTALRWGLIVGLPTLVLLIGGAVRLLRG